MNEQWEPYQKKYWTETWENSSYSFQELIDGDPWVGVKFSPLLPHILHYLKKDSKIIEAGCGLGQWVNYLSELGFDVTGIDFSETTIAKLQSIYPDKKYLIGDVTRFDFNNDIFDAVLSWGVVEHFIDGPSVALKEANRILKKDGFLFITVPCKNNLTILLSPLFAARKVIVKLVRKLVGKTSVKTPFFQYTFKKKEFKNYLQHAGFMPIKVIPISQEVGFAIIINTLFKIKKEMKLFYKNKRGKWKGLTRSGKIICMLLNKINPWLTPHQVFVIAKKS